MVSDWLAKAARLRTWLGRKKRSRVAAADRVRAMPAGTLTGWAGGMGDWESTGLVKIEVSSLR